MVHGTDASLPVDASVHAFLATVNGNEWYHRYQRIQRLLQPDVLRKTLTERAADITGFDVYAKPEEGCTETRYDVVLNWQTNFWHVMCNLDGTAKKFDEQVVTDDGMMKAFYGGRSGKMLDVGCNTGKNMLSAIKYSDSKIDAYGIEYSQDSVDLAVKALGEDHVFQGDATADFVSQHDWHGKFDWAHCNFVLQHMDPAGVDAALANISKCLVAGGEFLTTFKDAPSREKLLMCGMGEWADEIFIADLDEKEAYCRDGYLHTVIWDDDYYPGVTSASPPVERDLQKPGPHRRELYFYGLDWMKDVAKKHGLVARDVGVVCDAKMPFSVFSWKVIFVKEASSETQIVGYPIQTKESDLPVKTSVHAFLATVNGTQWYNRYHMIRKLLQPDVFGETLTEEVADITGYDVYAKPEEGSNETRYDVVLNWQTNFWHVMCELDGTCLKVDDEIVTDDSMMRAFYSGRSGKMIDVGCNTGKNMLSAIKYSDSKIDAHGVEFSQDSVDLAVKSLGDDHVFQGDATKDFVSQHGWAGQFAYAHCNFVLQHMDPEGVDSALKNIAKCLRNGGEFLTTFKDAPTLDQLSKWGLSTWANEIFTADLDDIESYIEDGYLHTVIWDDDYYPGVTSKTPPRDRDLQLAGPHRRELYFYSLEWMKQAAKKHGLVAKEVGIVCDAKMPFSVFSWKVVFVKQA